MTVIATSGAYLHIETALKLLWVPFTQLVDEMNSFSPRELSSYSDEHNQVMIQFQGWNPTLDEKAVRDYADQVIQNRCTDQFGDTFAARFMSQYVTVVMLSHALCEAFINSHLAIGLTRVYSHDVFRLIEKSEMIAKWLDGPKAFLTGYNLDKSKAVYHTLKTLNQQRNSLVHHKCSVTSDAGIVLEGSDFKVHTFGEGITWLRRFFSLPFDLNDHVRSYTEPKGGIRIQSGIVYGRHAPIEPASEHST